MILAPRYLPRIAATIGLFTRYGLLDYAKGEGLLRLQGAQLDSDSKPDENEPADARAVALRERLIELGPAYIKLGQVLSTRPDLVSPAYTKELEHLQDGVPPMDLDEVERIIEEELGAKVGTLFGSSTKGRSEALRWDRSTPPR